ncbi:MAG: SIMPL domain-containing protein [Candidatus Dojkabacteria bacterium]
MIDKKYLLAGGAVLAVCLTAIVCTLLISNGSFYIKNLGTSLEQNGQIVNSLTVSGDGKVFATPDIVELSVSSSEVAGTSKEALDIVGAKVKQAVEVALANGVDAKDIQTSNLSVSAEYDYNGNTPVFKGQRATMSVDIKIKGVGPDSSKATTIIDQISAIDKIQMGSISFDIEDKTALFTQARELAFNKAKQKADELSKLGGLKLLKPVSITDTATDITPPQSRNLAFDQAPTIASGVDGSLSSGQLQVSISLNVVWGIE